MSSLPKLSKHPVHIVGTYNPNDIGLHLRCVDIAIKCRSPGGALGRFFNELADGVCSGDTFCNTVSYTLQCVFGDIWQRYKFRFELKFDLLTTKVIYIALGTSQHQSNLPRSNVCYVPQ